MLSISIMLNTGYAADLNFPGNQDEVIMIALTQEYFNRGKKQVIFKVNMNTIEYMVVPRKNIGGNQVTLTCDGLTSKNATQFKYLGALVMILKNKIRAENT